MNAYFETLLKQGSIHAIAQLRHFAHQDSWISQLQIAFGANFDLGVAIDIASQFQSDDFSLLPKIRVLANHQLGSAYSQELKQILVSSDNHSLAVNRSHSMSFAASVYNRI